MQGLDELLAGALGSRVVAVHEKVLHSGGKPDFELASCVSTASTSSIFGSAVDKVNPRGRSRGDAPLNSSFHSQFRGPVAPRAGPQQQPAPTPGHVARPGGERRTTPFQRGNFAALGVGYTDLSLSSASRSGSDFRNLFKSQGRLKMLAPDKQAPLRPGQTRQPQSSPSGYGGESEDLTGGYSNSSLDDGMFGLNHPGMEPVVTVAEGVSIDAKEILMQLGMIPRPTSDHMPTTSSSLSLSTCVLAPVASPPRLRGEAQQQQSEAQQQSELQQRSELQQGELQQCCDGGDGYGGGAPDSPLRLDALNTSDDVITPQATRGGDDGNSSVRAAAGVAGTACTRETISASTATACSFLPPPAGTGMCSMREAAAAAVADDSDALPLSDSRRRKRRRGKSAFGAGGTTIDAMDTSDVAACIAPQHLVSEVEGAVPVPTECKQADSTCFDPTFARDVTAAASAAAIVAGEPAQEAAGKRKRRRPVRSKLDTDVDMGASHLSAAEKSVETEAPPPLVDEVDMETAPAAKRARVGSVSSLRGTRSDEQANMVPLTSPTGMPASSTTHTADDSAAAASQQEGLAVSGNRKQRRENRRSLLSLGAPSSPLPLAAAAVASSEVAIAYPGASRGSSAARSQAQAGTRMPVASPARTVLASPDRVGSTTGVGASGRGNKSGAGKAVGTRQQIRRATLTHAPAPVASHTLKQSPVSGTVSSHTTPGTTPSYIRASPSWTQNGADKAAATARHATARTTIPSAVAVARPGVPSLQPAFATTVVPASAPRPKGVGVRTVTAAAVPSPCVASGAATAVKPTTVSKGISFFQPTVSAASQAAAVTSQTARQAAYAARVFATPTVVDAASNSLISELLGLAM